MKTKQNKKKNPELRLTNPAKELYKKVSDLAKKGNRSIPKQLKRIIEKYDGD